MTTKKLLGSFFIITAILAVGAGSAEAKGRKFGLFVGINKYVTSNPLSGCVNDAIKMRETLQAKFGFNAADTKLLLDADATRDGIINSIKAFQSQVGAGDIFVVHYSGHGTLFPDKYSEDRDETDFIFMEEMNQAGQMEVVYPRDKYDSAIVPVDSSMRTSGKPWRNLILDDELSALFAVFTQKGAQVVFISDSCHSGTIARNQKGKMERRMTPLAAAFGVRRFEEIEFTEPAVVRTSGYPVPVKGLYLAITGARDNEYALDAGGLPIPMGLFTSTFLAHLNKPTGPKMTYQAIMAAVSKEVAQKALKDFNDQNPQIDARYGNPASMVFSVPAS